MKTDLFQSCGHCWVVQICWHMECSTFRASSFRIWNRSAGSPSLPVALFEVILPKAHLTSHSLVSGSRWVITPLWSHWCIGFVEMNFHKEMESGETSKVLIRRKTVGVNRHTRVSSERSSHPHRSVNHSYGVLLPGLLWPVILLCLGRWIWINPYLVYLKVLPCMGTYLGQDGF